MAVRLGITSFSENHILCDVIVHYLLRFERKKVLEWVSFVVVCEFAGVQIYWWVQVFYFCTAVSISRLL